MKTTLVTTCWNEIKSVENWTRDVLGQSRIPDEIIIIDNFSSDGTYEYLMDYSGRFTVYQKKCSVAQGRNEAIRRAHNEIIVSTDMGTRLDPDWHENLVKPFIDDHSIDVVAGNYEYVYPSKNGIGRAEYFYKNRGRAKMGPGFLPSSRNIAYKKHVWETIGGYQEGLKNATDDTIFAFEIHDRAFNMALAPNSFVYWNRHSRLEDFLKETARYAYGNGEARLRSTLLTDHVSSASYPLWQFLFAAQATAHSGKAVWRALKANDFPMLVYIPYFVIMNSLEYAHSYRLGYLDESDRLKSMRQRIKELGLS
jgi:cellulose synthase/poly-beta-1,6-N-acetylglucosamine synthase-like glycosyltransferase